MAQADLIAQTPRGSSIQKIETGKFLVCDSENVCFFTRSLHLAEEQLEEWVDEDAFSSEEKGEEATWQQHGGDRGVL